jgi:carbon storage regulator
MLVLSRKENEELVIGDKIVVRIIRIAGGRVQLGIEAPSEVSIRRAEIAPLSIDRDDYEAPAA